MSVMTVVIIVARAATAEAQSLADRVSVSVAFKTLHSHIATASPIAPRMHVAKLVQGQALRYGDVLAGWWSLASA